MYSSCELRSEALFILDQHQFKCRHEKSHCPDADGKCGNTVKIDYYSRTSGLKGAPGDVVCHDNLFPSSAAKAQNIIEQDGGDASERVPRFVVEFDDFLLRATMKRDRLSSS